MTALLATSSHSAVLPLSPSARKAKLRAEIPFGAHAFWLEDRLFLLTKRCPNYTVIALPDGSYLPASAISESESFRAGQASSENIVHSLSPGDIVACCEEV